MTLPRANGLVRLTPGVSHSDTRRAKLFVDPSGRDFMTVASPEGEADAAAKGYRFVRIEGYAPAAP